MATVTTLVDNVITRFQKDPNSSVISRNTIVNYLNEAQDIIEAEVILPAMQKSATIDLVADTQAYNLASDLFKASIFRYTANDYVLKEIPFLALQKRFASSTGTPQEFSIYGNQAYLYPTPDANETAGVKYYYIKTLDTLVESGAGTGEVATPEVPSNFHWVLERGAEMLVCQQLGYKGRADAAETKFREGILQMLTRFQEVSDNPQNLIQTEDDMIGSRNYNYDPYQS
jgi:hypothetical protein